MYEAAANCKNIARATVTNWETRSLRFAGFSYAVRHGMKVQLVTPYRIGHLQRYGVTIRANVTCVDPSLECFFCAVGPNVRHHLDETLCLGRNNCVAYQLV